MSKKTTTTIWVYAAKQSWDSDWDVAVKTWESQETATDQEGLIFLRTLEVEAYLPKDFDPVPHQLRILKKNQQAVMAAAQSKLTEMQAQINNLLCIEHKP